MHGVEAEGSVIGFRYLPHTWRTTPPVVGALLRPEELEGAVPMSSGVVRTVAPSWMLVSSPMTTGAPSPKVEVFLVFGGESG